MGIGTKITLVCGGLALLLMAVLALTVQGSYNALVSLDQAVDAQWGQVENVYQRRSDLVPNLVATVKGAAAFEKDTFTAVAEARARVGQAAAGPRPAGDPAALEKFQRAQEGLGAALSRLLVVVERYPDLRATENFRELQAQLEGTENRISVERGRFSEAVQLYNTTIKSFPALLYAGMFGFKDKPYFTATPGAETPPKVQFDFGKPAAAPAPAKP